MSSGTRPSPSQHTHLSTGSGTCAQIYQPVKRVHEWCKSHTATSSSWRRVDGVEIDHDSAARRAAGPRQFDLCTGRDVGDFELQTHSCIIKYIFPCVDIAGFARHVASRRGAFIGAVDIYVRAFGILARRRRDAEAVGGADEAEGEGEGEARHLFACDRHVRRTRFPVEKPLKVNGLASVEVTRGSPCVAAKTIWKAF